MFLRPLQNQFCHKVRSAGKIHSAVDTLGAFKWRVEIPNLINSRGAAKKVSFPP